MIAYKHGLTPLLIALLLSFFALVGNAHPVTPDVIQLKTLDILIRYIPLGIGHILTGPDHLLFVSGLLFITFGDTARLIKAITAFTVGHSITLSLAVFGLINLPLKPVESLIAATIFVLAIELNRRITNQSSIISRRPWVIAGGFGLVHGLGFASALMATGLPNGAISTGLLGFNLGVEIGQLLFVSLILTTHYLFQQYWNNLPNWAAKIPGYSIGSLSLFWMCERILA